MIFKWMNPIKVSIQSYTTKSSHTLFIGNIPPSVTKLQLKHKFKGFGLIKKIRISDSKENKFYSGFLEFLDANTKLKNRDLILKESPILKLLDSKTPSSLFYSTPKTKWTEQSLAKFFGKFPDITKVQPIKDEVTSVASKPKYGFVEYQDRVDAVEAIKETHNRDFEGNILEVAFVGSKKKSSTNTNSNK
ncbi:hypothetical protein BC833DRAFT_612158 [Globomyces pollinis-pini]|nr:hypothetical protein BC833DRAFT_612158 [Globomyces pollinis-pini]